jgi:hypothetical protein
MTYLSTAVNVNVYYANIFAMKNCVTPSAMTTLHLLHRFHVKVLCADIF